jgi:hypothetical protein
MLVTLHATKLPLTRELEEYALRSVMFALGRFSTRVDRVSVRIADVNGPRGGVDKECRIRIDSHRLGVLVVRDRDAGLFAAIDGAAARAARTIQRRIDLRIDRRRHAASYANPPARD